MSHAVTCGDYADDGDPDEEWVIAGFATAEAAQEYARRFIRAAIEDLRGDAASNEDLRDMYFRWGEFALTPGLETTPWVDFCIVNPAARPAETDYTRLDPNPPT